MDLALIGSSLSIEGERHVAVFPVLMRQPKARSKWNLKEPHELVVTVVSKWHEVAVAFLVSIAALLPE